MAGSPVELLRAALPYVPRALVDDSSLLAVSRLACRLEGLTCAASYLECRLMPTASQVDLLVQVKPRIPQQRSGRSWLSRGLALGAPSLWLEFDDAGASRGQAHLPGLHLRIDEPNGDPACPFEPGAALQKLEGLRDAALLDPGACAAMRRCIESLPPAGRAIHASVMPSRTPQESKLYVALPVGGLSDYARRAGWQSAWPDPANLLAEFCGSELNGDTLYCDLTFRPALAPSLGLVFSQWHVKGGVSDPTRARIRDRFVQTGLCSEAQSRALASWLEAQPKASSTPELPELRRCLDLKVRARPDQALEVKAYLGFASPEP